LRIIKYSMLVAALVLILAGCNNCGSDKNAVPSAKEMIDKHKAVRIGTQPVNIPFEFGKGVDVQGLDVDVGAEIAKDLNTEAKWDKNSGYDQMFQSLAEGKVELLIGTIAIDPKREDKFSFSKPYYQTEDAIAYRMDSPYENLASLSGKKVGVGSGRPSEKYMDDQKGITVVKFDTIDLALGALNHGEVDAVVGDREIMTYSTFKSFLNVVVSKAGFNPYKYAAVVRKSEPELLESINKTMDRLVASGKVAEYKKTWYDDVAAAAGEKHGDYEKEEKLKKSAKNIAVTITNNRKEIETDRLDGFELKLEGPTGTFKSTPINTTGNKGICKFANPVPPGTYKLDMMSIFRASATVEIQPLAKSALTMDIIVSRDLNIFVK
jgi:ABC-type amino acid transport substrate-binding protein